MMNPDQVRGNGDGTSSNVFPDTGSPKPGIRIDVEHCEFEQEEKKSQAKRFEFLLKQTEIFAHFMTPSCDKSSTASTKARGRSPKTDEGKRNKTSSISLKTDHRCRRTEQEEDEELLTETNATYSKTTVKFDASPGFIKGGEMRDYQVRGLNWLISLNENKINGILADEMGLGKTLQTISLLGYMKHYRNSSGPHIIIVPKSTLTNWMNEFKKWCPSIRVICLIGDKISRKTFIKDTLLPGKWDVCVTSYEMIIREKFAFKKFHWSYLIIDEGHRIKNDKTKLSKFVREFQSTNRVLLTGTPLQNNLHELWSLLNFLLPEVFGSSEDFDSWFNINQCLGDSTLVERLHSVLHPFLLRRIKSEVEKGIPPKKELKIFVEMSKLQREWYTKILMNDIDVVNSVGKPDKHRLQNILMQLRKCTNHPYLFQCAEPGPPYTNDVHIIHNSGKLQILDKLLPKFQEEGSRVLIFSQMTRMMNILEDYCTLRAYDYCRFDGKTHLEERQRQIDVFNQPKSTKFLFILSTRSGGLGINLASADVVVIYDSDWNPQCDLQAMDRCHRIGQTKEVRIFRLITGNTVEEKLVERADIKLHLDRLVIQQGSLLDRSKQFGNAIDTLKMVRFGVEKIFASKDTGITDEDIDTILARSKLRTEKIAQDIAKMDEQSLRSFTIDVSTDPIPSLTALPVISCHEFEGVDYRNLRSLKVKNDQIDRDEKYEGRRSSLLSLSSTDINGQGFSKLYGPNLSCGNLYTSNDITTTGHTKRLQRHLEQKEVIIRRIRKPQEVHDFQFCSPRLFELYMQELDYYRHNTGYIVPLIEDVPVYEALEIQKFEQARLSMSFPLTVEEILEKKLLLSEGFPGWRRKDFENYVLAISQYGCENLELISNTVKGKSIEEVVAYHQVFWKRCHECFEFEKTFTDESINSEIRKLIMKRKHLLDFKMNQYLDSPNDFELSYSSTFEFGNRFNAVRDRALLLTLHKVGLDSTNYFQTLHSNILHSTEYDFFLRSRSPRELHARCNFLLYMLELEYSSSKTSLMKENKPSHSIANDASRNPTSTLSSNSGISSGSRNILTPIKIIPNFAQEETKLTPPSVRTLQFLLPSSPFANYDTTKVKVKSPGCSGQVMRTNSTDKDLDPNISSLNPYVAVERLDFSLKVENTHSRKRISPQSEQIRRSSPRLLEKKRKLPDLIC